MIHIVRGETMMLASAPATVDLVLATEVAVGAHKIITIANG